MTDYNEEPGYSSLIEVDDTRYLVQGRIDQELTMIRPIDKLLECEHDNVQKMLGEKEL